MDSRLFGVGNGAPAKELERARLVFLLVRDLGFRTRGGGFERVFASVWVLLFGTGEACVCVCLVFIRAKIVRCV